MYYLMKTLLVLNRKLYCNIWWKKRWGFFLLFFLSEVFICHRNKDNVVISPKTNSGGQ